MEYCSVFRLQKSVYFSWILCVRDSTEAVAAKNQVHQLPEVQPDIHCSCFFLNRFLFVITPHPATEYSPFILLHGREPLTADIRLTQPQNVSTSVQENVEFRSKLL